MARKDLRSWGLWSNELRAVKVGEIGGSETCDVREGMNRRGNWGLLGLGTVEHRPAEDGNWGSIDSDVCDDRMIRGAVNRGLSGVGSIERRSTGDGDRGSIDSDA